MTPNAASTLQPHMAHEHVCMPSKVQTWSPALQTEGTPEQATNIGNLYLLGHWQLSQVYLSSTML